MSSVGIGIHLGCSSLCIAAAKNGKTEVIANAGGQRTTPAFVTILENENTIGMASKQSSHRFPAQTITHVIKLLGKNYDDEDVQNIVKNSSPCCIGEKDNKIVYKIMENGKEKTYKPSYILTLMLKNALSTAQSFVGSDVNEVVVTVPDNSNESFKNVLNDTLTNAGFEVMRLISYCAASTLGYGIGLEDVEKQPYYVLVVKIGGQRSYFSVLQVLHGMVSIKSSVNFEMGGDVLTGDIANHFASVFKQKFKSDISNNMKAMNKLKRYSETCKHVLSTMPTAQCHIDSLYDGIDFSATISRSLFETLVAAHLRGFLEPIPNLLQDSKLQQSDISKVILSGGTCNIPALNSMVSKILPDAEVMSSIPPEEVNALGCARECGILSSQESIDINKEDCLLLLAPGSVYISIGETEHEIVEPQSVLPVVYENEFKVNDLNSNPISIQFQINKDEDKIQIGEVAIEKFLEFSKIFICFKYLSDGHISITASNENKTTSEHLSIKCS